MFDRFTERARRVVVLAQEESGRLRHNYIGTEHLLLSLIRGEEGVAAQALYACGVTLDEAREGVEGIVGYGESDASQKPFTPRSKRVLEMSLQEAQDLRQDHIGTEHLLLGLLAEGGGVATAVLSSLDVGPERVRREVFGRLGRGMRPSPQDELGTLGWAREALRRSFGRYPRAEDRSTVGKFTGLARKVVVLAQDEARRFNHNYIGTEHILLDLTNETEGVATRVLRNLDVDPDAIRREIIKRLPDGEDGFDPSGEVEREMEGGWHRTLFRGRVGGIQTGTERGTFILDVDYSYRLPTDPALTRASLDPQDVADVNRTRLGEVRIETLEGAAEVAGTHLMETFHDLLEITITVVRRPEPSDPLAPTFSISATFCR